jgi:hypothetical protein
MPHIHTPSAPAVLRTAPLLLLLGGVLAAGCTTAGADPNPEAAAMSEAQAGEWEPLFDGSDLSRWRGFRRPDLPASWSVQDGTLAFTPVSDRAQRGDIVTRDQYGDFELELEWKISEGGNSGVMYRVGEEEEYPWRTGPEMQVLDDDRHPDGKIPSHRAGALYDLIVPPSGLTRPVGEWNQARVVVRGNRIQHWLNGHPTADIEIGGEDWNRRMAESKFREMPLFATRREGHIALQDHDDPVWYRNIRIRRLSPGS